MIKSKTEAELAIMIEGGRHLGKILQRLLTIAQPGITLDQIEEQAVQLINQTGGTPSFRTVSGYRWATCLCVNEEVVHGIPTGYRLVEGDFLTIDIGLFYQGFHTDTAWTKIIKTQNSIRRSADKTQNKDKEKFLRVGEEALKKAIAQVKVDNRIGQISQAIQRVIEAADYSVVKSLVGHGIGRKLHEDPQIPGFVRGKITRTAKLKPGMTLAIEIIYAAGRGSVVYDNDDGWTIATRDRSLSAVFEHTVAVTPAGPLVLTSVS